jgi:hypothetical protein
MTTTENTEPLVLGLNKILTVDFELDRDGDLELYLDTECDYANHYVFISHKDQVALRDHLNKLLGETK